MGRLIKLIFGFIFVFALLGVGFFLGFMANESSKQNELVLIKSVSSGEYERDLWSTVQSWRRSVNKPTYENSPYTCDFAAIRAVSAYKEFSHGGFLDLFGRYRPNGNVRVAENLSQVYSSPQEALDLWLDSPKHKENLDQDFKYSCLRCVDKTCAHIFSNF